MTEGTTLTVGNLLMGSTAGTIIKGYAHYWDESGITAPDLLEVLGWIVETQASANCEDIRSIMNYLGKMIIAYGSEAVLVTLYLIILLISRLSNLNSKWSKNNQAQPATTGILWTLLRRIHEAAHETLRVFLDATSLFSVTMLIAATVTASTTSLTVHKLATDSPSRATIALRFPTKSAVQLSAFVALFSIFPTIALHSSAPSSFGRKFYRKCVWLLMGILTVLMLVRKTRARAKIDDFMQYVYLRLTTQLNSQTLFGQDWIDKELSSHLAFTVLQRIEKFKYALSFITALYSFYYFRNQIDEHAGDTNEDHD
ncbi:hypothetical protein P171DRAFT_491351 [Karstenula rhodostoma CBS 690.94]|uniref:Uncharacterized protein n=1 Tax=Karstenula rhodostoma CBS 690.94 TaxID=1392251 RepID=A0A9P4P7U3_9PLEO|nr:hypothetical protein P171DRAFT_491351 [Karstenula rhodostoma CBS 690.94]